MAARGDVREITLRYRLTTEVIMKEEVRFRVHGAARVPNVTAYHVSVREYDFLNKDDPWTPSVLHARY